MSAVASLEQHAVWNREALVVEENLKQIRVEIGKRAFQALHVDSQVGVGIGSWRWVSSERGSDLLLEPGKPAGELELLAARLASRAQRVRYQDSRGQRMLQKLAFFDGAHSTKHQHDIEELIAVGGRLRPGDAIAVREEELPEKCSASAIPCQEAE